MVGCNNPKVRPDTAHIELMKKLIANDIIVIVSGCSAQAAAKAGLLEQGSQGTAAAKACKRVCELVDIPPILHMGSCVDISRMMILASDIAKDWGIDICSGSRGRLRARVYVRKGGFHRQLRRRHRHRHLPGRRSLHQGRSRRRVGLLQGSIKDWVGANYTVELDIEKLGDKMMERIEEKRAALGI